MLNKQKTLERDVLKACLDYLEMKRIFHYRQNSGALTTDKGRFMRFGYEGSPDIVAVILGRYIGIECKGSSGDQSEAQKIFEGNLIQAGGEYIVARSIDDLIAAGI